MGASVVFAHGGRYRQAVPLEAREDWISTEEVAKAADVSTVTISRWRKRGLLPEPAVISAGRRGRRFRWPPETAAHATFLKKGLGFGYSDEELLAALADGSWKTSFAEKA